MAVQILKQHRLGDMTAVYLTDDDRQQVGMTLIPAGLSFPDSVSKNMEVDGLIQVKVAGDIYNEAYALGISMRNSETVRNLSYAGQKREETEERIAIITEMTDQKRLRAFHRLEWRKGAPYVKISCSLENTGEKAFLLEMFESFSLSALSPWLQGDGHGVLRLHRIRSVWSQEGRLETIPIEDLQLEPAWEPHAVRCEKYGQAGSLPVNRFFPFAAVEDTESHVFWGAQIAHNASWQMELYRKDDGLALSGGLADRDFGHWTKNILPGQTFETPEAIVSCARTDSLDIFSGRLTEAAKETLEQVPESEKDLPIIFNEYCTTWGNPSHENIKNIVDRIRDKGFRYFVIDCGWYKTEGVPWDISMGDYEVSKELFPEGLEETVKYIRDAGMIPGIWFEIENVGKAARAYEQTEHLLKKDGAPLTSYFRRFWDMRDPWVQDYLTRKVIDMLKQYGFGYLKIDDNETIGIGCDGAESLGEGLRQNMEASFSFIQKIRQEIPEMVIENCASGGHRLEPKMMSAASMASFSDAHECEEIPLIAANLHRVLHPAQSQIWAVIRKEDSQKRIAYSLISTFLGRMCISGDVTDLSGEQWSLIAEGMDFYRKIAPVIRDGQSYRYGPKILSARHPEGWQAILRTGKEGGAFLVIHQFDGPVPERIDIPLPSGCPETIVRVYSDSAEKITLQDRILSYCPRENRQAAAVLLG